MQNILVNMCEKFHYDETFITMITIFAEIVCGNDCTVYSLWVSASLAAGHKCTN